MLQKIRDNSQGILAKIFIGFIIAVFALFGVDSIVGTFINATPVLSINDVEIDTREIDNLAQRKIQEYLVSLGEDADFSNFDEALFRAEAVNEIIQRELLDQSARNSGMVVSSLAIDRRILQTTDFQIDGVYNHERATILLQSMGFTPASYRAALARDTLLNQLLLAYSTSGFVTQAEFEKLAAMVNQKRRFRFIGLSLDAMNADVEADEAEIAAYFELNKERFRIEEMVRIAWLEIDREALFDEVEVTEGQLQTLYAEQTRAFQAQTERRAAHILFEASDAGAFEEALALAAGVKARLDDGDDFATLAAEYSDDTGSALDGGDVGYTTGDSFVQEFETALQQLAVGEVSSPVRTEFGIHLIKLLEMNEIEIESFEESRARLERELKTREVDRIFLVRSEELGNLAFESVDLEEPARALGLEIQESEWFGRSGGSGITAMRSVIDASFSFDVLEDRLNSELIRLNANRSVVINLLEHKLSELPALDDVKDEISILLRTEKMREQARMLGETIVSALQSGQNIDTLLDAQGLVWEQLDALERDDMRLNPSIMQEAFAMPRPQPGSTGIKGFAVPTGQYVVMELQEVIDGNHEELSIEQAEALRAFVSQQSAALDFTGLIFSLENRAEILGRDVVVPQDF
jgi:peptidyl-prolyl cis-trans isomerase D